MDAKSGLEGGEAPVDEGNLPVREDDDEKPVEEATSTCNLPEREDDEVNADVQEALDGLQQVHELTGADQRGSLHVDVPVVPMSNFGPYTAIGFEVLDSNLDRIALCGYSHNRKTSGPGIAIEVAAALNRVHGHKLF